MPLEIHFPEVQYPGQSYLYIKFPADIVAEEFETEYLRIFDDHRFIQNMPAIWDLSDLVLVKRPVSEIRVAVGVFRKYSVRRGQTYRSGLVTNQPVDFHLLKVYLGLLQLIGQVRYQIFKSVPEAEAWVTSK